jgi:hypothetical protein
VVVFDTDEMLIDSVDFRAAARREALRHFGHDVPEGKVRESNQPPLRG